jgi:acyl transferase domain-containing protein
MPPGWGTFLKGTTKFDNVEFGTASKDAMSMTASTRRVIELSFLAMLDSGIDSRGKRIGSFVAGTNIERFEGVRVVT